jgi:hypothetical protein
MNKVSGDLYKKFRRHLSHLTPEVIIKIMTTWLYLLLKESQATRRKLEHFFGRGKVSWADSYEKCMAGGIGILTKNRALCRFYLSSGG